MLSRAIAAQFRILFDYLNNTSRARFYKDGTLVHIRVAIAGCVILRRNVVVSDAAFRQYCTDTEFFSVAIRRPMLTDDVFAEARAIIDPKDTSDCSGRRTNRTSNNCAEGASRLPALFCAFFRSPNGSLCLGPRRD